MKLRFSINYRTEWGQQMVVSITYHAVDGTERHVQLPMTTQDGDQWTGETVVLESRRSPVERFTYFYIVTDGEGQELRREWTRVRRCYTFDATRTFIFNDQWLDMPLNSHLYTSAYRVTALRCKEESRVEEKRMPLFRKTLLFRVSAPQLTGQQAVAIVGSHPALGAWNPSRYLPMEKTGQEEWTATLNVDWIGMPLEYKFVVIDRETHELLAWEEGDNREVTEELEDGQVMVLFGEQLRWAEKPWRVAGVSIPLFALRSEHSCGVGDFGDLRKLVDWATETGMKVIQLLPVNDTTVNRHWGDSCPYNIVSAFALHPHYMDLGQLGSLKDKRQMTAFRRQQRELNALSYSDYEAVDRVKTDYVHRIFEERGRETIASADFKAWREANADWLQLSYHAHSNYPNMPFLVQTPEFVGESIRKMQKAYCHPSRNLSAS